MMQFFSEDIEFLRELYIHRSLDMYFFHKKYMLSPAQLGMIIKKYSQMGYVVLNGRNIELTSAGCNWIVANRKNIFLAEREKYWKQIPFFAQYSRITPGDIYRPNIKKLDPELLKLLEEDGEHN